MPRLRVSLSVGAFTVALSLILAAAAFTRPTAGTMKLGVLVGLTGSSNIIGVPYANGAKLAAHEINQRGGINGQKVSLDFADNETQPVAGVQAALKLVSSDHVDTLICSCYSTIFFPLAEALKSQDIAITNDASSTPEVRTLPGFHYHDHSHGRRPRIGASKFAYGLGFHKAAMLTVNDQYGSAFRSVVSSAYKKLGGSLLVDIVADGGLPDYRPEMKRIVDTGANALLMGTYTADARLQFRQLKQLGWNGVAFKLYPSGTALNKDPEANGHFFGLESTWLSGARNQAWQARYKKEYGDDPSIWAAEATTPSG